MSSIKMTVFNKSKKIKGTWIKICQSTSEAKLILTLELSLKERKLYIYVYMYCIYIVASTFTNCSAIYIHSLATSLFKLTATAPSTGGRDMLHRMMKLLPGLLLKTKSWRRCGRGFPSLSESSWQSSTSIFFCS